MKKAVKSTARTRIPSHPLSRETVIGVMGQTGWATGVHLHFEIYQDGKATNPLEVLPALN